MDVKMPEMNGYEATRLIREFDKTLPIIAQTAYGLKGDSEKALDAGCNDYISKPINSALLIKKIKCLFDK
jgi:CheY-like chemotaxis protein